MPEISETDFFGTSAIGVATGPRPVAAPQRGSVRTVYTAPEDPTKAAQAAAGLAKTQADVSMIPLDIRAKELDIQRKERELIERERELQLTGGVKTTEGEKKAATLTTRLVGAMQDIQNALLESPEAAKPGGLQSFVGMFSESAARQITPAARKRIEDAQLTALDSALTLGTGAAYTREQLEGYRNTLFPRFGDDPATIADKRRRFLREIEAGRIQAGAAAPSIDQAIKAADAIFGPEQRQRNVSKEGLPAIFGEAQPRIMPDGTIEVTEADGTITSYPNRAAYDQAVRGVRGLAVDVTQDIGPGDPDYERMSEAQKRAFEMERQRGPAGYGELLVEGAVPFSGEIAGVSGGIGEMLAGRDFGRGYDVAQRAEDIRLEQARARLGIPGMVAESVGMAGGALLTGQALGRLPGIARLGPGGRSFVGDVAFGAATGAGRAQPGERGMGAVTGAGAAALGNIAGQTAGRLIAPRVPEDVRALREMGVRTTTGQGVGRAANRFESALSSIPFVGDLTAAARRNAIIDVNNGVLNQSLETAGLSKVLPKGSEGTRSMAFTKNAFDQGYDATRAQMRFVRDAQFDTDTNALLVRTAGGELEEAEAKRLKTIFDNKIARKIKSGAASGDQYKTMSSDLGKLIDGAHRQGKYEFEGALRELQTAVDQAARRASPPDAVAALDKLDEGYALFVLSQKAAARRGGETGVFTPASFDAEVQRMDPTVRSNAYLRGEAFGQELSQRMLNVLGRELPTSGTTERGMASLVATGAGGALASPWLAVPASIGALYAPGVREGVSAIVAGSRVEPLVKAGMPRATAERIVSAAERGLPIFGSSGSAAALERYGP